MKHAQNGLQAVPGTNEYNPQAVFESLALKGDLSGLNPDEKVAYYQALCERLKLDPATQPFLPLSLNGKVILYASKSATDQLARVWHVNRTIIDRQMMPEAGVYVVIVRAELPDGRSEDSTGAVPIGGAKGEGFANALMKAETKAKRRATLSILGLGMLDESEVEAIPAERKKAVDFTSDVKTPDLALNPAPAPATVEIPAEPIDDPKAALLVQVMNLARELNQHTIEGEQKWTKALVREFAEHLSGEPSVATLDDLSFKALTQVKESFQERLSARLAQPGEETDLDAIEERKAIEAAATP